MKSIQRTGEILLPAIAYGDAAGLPVETRSHDYIAENYGRIDHLIPVRENPFYIGDFDTGTWSDDTQLSLAVSRSLSKAKFFDMRSIANEHVLEYKRTPQVTKPSGQTVKRGWGGSTTAAMERYLSGRPTEECGTFDGAGNGVIMKMAPLAYWLIAHDTDPMEAYEELDAFTTFTHNSRVARVATRVHYDVLSELASSRRVLRRFGLFAHTRARLHEAFVYENDHEVSRSLQYLTNKEPVNTELILAHTDGKGFHVPQTLAMAYGAFLAHGGRFTESVYEGVNLGGDTDSTASIAAAMSVFKWGGITEEPADFRTTAQYDALVEASQDLTSVSLER